MQKINLIQVLPSFNSGGVEQGTLDLANYLASLNIKSYITSNGGEMQKYLNKKFVNHIKLPVHSKNFFLMPFIARKLNKIIRNEKINILHIRSRAPAWLLPYLDKKNIKTVSTFHNVYGQENLLKKFYNKQLGNVDKVIAISEYVKKEIVKSYNIEESKIKVINRGIDTKFFDANINDEEKFISFLKKNNIDANKNIVLFPGRLTSWKGQIEFLNIVQQFKDYPIVFYFVGDNKNQSYSKKFLNEIKRKDLSKCCRILNHLNHNDLKNMYACCNLVISAPLKPEGFGRTVSEALAMKKIVLAYNFGGVKNQLEKLDSLYKVNPHDYNDLKDKIHNVLKLENNTVNNMGEVARKHIIENFSKEIMLKSYNNFYLEL